MASAEHIRHRPAQSLFLVMFLVLVFGTAAVCSEPVYSEQRPGHASETKPETLPTPQALAGGKSSSAFTDVILNDRKKSVADNEVFDSSTKGQLNLLLSELREVKTEIREARQEHGRLASGVAEISGQVRIISDRKDQIKKKIRKLTKTLSKKDHHRKVKNGLRSLQQDHERILQAMTKAKLLRGNSARRNNRTNHHNHTSNHHNNRNKYNDKDNDVNDSKNSANGSVGGGESKPGKKSKGRNDIENSVDDNGEVAPEDNLPVVLPVEIEKKTDSSLDVILDNRNSNAAIAGNSIDSVPSTTTTTTTTTTTPEPTPEPLPANCYEVLQHGNWTSGIYYIQPDSMEPMKVWCDQSTDGGGWTLMVARKPQDTQEDFSRPWADYKRGFGQPETEYWIGLEVLHQMTKNKRHELRVNITDWQKSEYHAQWKEFTVGSEDEAYILNVGRYVVSSSTAGDALKWHNSMKFSTVDRDNDALMGGHCARKNQGGWWYRGYRGCYQAHPTGIYQRRTSSTTMAPSTTSTPKTSANSTVTTTSSNIIRNVEHGPFIYWINWRSNNNLYPKTMFLMIRPGLN
uniref:Angiopoietin-related protein 2-like n=2 Tax=Hirondellea gigas TaxID=1518452 RepID=A0A6A7FPP6_9CRUS